MPVCPICGDLLTPDAKACALCGTSLSAMERMKFDDAVKWDLPEENQAESAGRPVVSPGAPTNPENLPTAPIDVVASPGPAEVPPPVPAPAGPVPSRKCPSCGTLYGPEHLDPFCACGLELVPVDSPPALPPVPPAEERPAAGTGCLVLYGPDKKPRHYFPIRKDVTLIGRPDPLRNNFPDIDLEEWLDEAGARRVSRKHALLLHTRADDSYSLRPLAGNTGTQIEQDMVEPLRDYPLVPGTRLILGGSVRFKFEIMP